MTTGTYDSWHTVACHIQGHGHMQRSIPCQDRAAAWRIPRPCVCVLDGRGSAPLSHIGVRYASRVLRARIDNLEAELATILDDSNNNALAELGWRGMAHRIYHAAAMSQHVLAKRYDQPSHHFEFTLSLAIVGTQRTGWLVVGDSPLVIIRHQIAGMVAIPETCEFANATTFVSTDPPPDAVSRCGLFRSTSVNAMCAITDGAASRLIHASTLVPAEAVQQIMQRLALGQWSAADLYRVLRDPSWHLTTNDDRAIAVLINTIPPPCPEPYTLRKFLTTSSACFTAKDNVVGFP